MVIWSSHHGFTGASCLISLISLSFVEERAQNVLFAVLGKDSCTESIQPNWREMGWMDGWTWKVSGKQAGPSAWKNNLLRERLAAVAVALLRAGPAAKAGW